MFPHTITLYNKYESDDYTSGYQRTVLTDVLFIVSKGTNVDTTGLKDADAVRITIPFDGHTDYLSPIAWDANKIGHWTLKEGDIVVKGVVSDEDIDPETLKAKYNDVYQITTIDMFDFGGLQHWKVGAN
jgi:hypothetical protein